jgi:hypothetical protein
MHGSGCTVLRGLLSPEVVKQVPALPAGLSRRSESSLAAPTHPERALYSTSTSPFCCLQLLRGACGDAVGGSGAPLPRGSNLGAREGTEAPGQEKKAESGRQARAEVDRLQSLATQLGGPVSSRRPCGGLCPPLPRPAHSEPAPLSQPESEPEPRPPSC